MDVNKLIMKGKEFLEKNPEIIKDVQRIASENPETVKKVKDAVVDMVVDTMKNKK